MPYPRLTVEKVQAAGGLWAYSHPSKTPHPPVGSLCTTCNSENGFSWALAGNTALNNQGAMMISSVYNPGMAVANNCGTGYSRECEHSLAQIWASTGNCEDCATNSCGRTNNNCTYGASGNAVQSAEFGWLVQWDVNSDTNTHIFTFSTQNGYDQSSSGAGCYNLTCNQFVQVSNPPFYPGQTISGIVTPGSGNAPIEGAWQVFNPGTAYGTAYENWYFYLDGQEIGYYPGSLFVGQMVTQASSIEVGGEIATDAVNAPNVDVVMGSGFPAVSGYGFGDTAYLRDIYYLEPGSGSGTIICGTTTECPGGFCYNPMSSVWGSGPQACGYDATHYAYYDLSTTLATGGSQSTCWGPYFYYGGGF